MESSWIRLDGVLPPNSTYVITRQASDESIQNCADFIEPDEFLKHNGDDGIKITHIGYLPDVFQNDTTAWMKMSITLDAIGYAMKIPEVWDVSGVNEATRYYMLTRKMDVCGGNGGDWNDSRGCVNEACDSTNFDLGEWTPIQCGLSPSAGDMPEGADASADVAIFAETITTSVPQFLFLQRVYCRVKLSYIKTFQTHLTPLQRLNMTYLKGTK